MEIILAVEENEPYKVLFARERGHVTREPGMIIIAPSQPFADVSGYEIHVEIIVLPRLGVEPQIEMRTAAYLGFLGKLKSGGDLAELLAAFEEHSSDTLPSNKLSQFFTMLPELQAYRKLVGRLGPEETFLVLRSINDMVAVSEGAGGGTWLRQARESRLFTRGFLRQSESYFAWKNAGPILKGEEFEEVGRLSEKLRIRFHLAGRPNAHDLEFGFSLNEPVLPKRFAVVIGKNGVGKSQTLSHIARSALRGSGELTDGDGDRPQINRLLAFYPTATSANVFPGQRRGGRIWYRRFSLSHPGVGRGRQTTSDLVIQLARTEERIAGTERLEMFLVALRAIDGYRDLAFRRRGEPGYVHIYDLLEGGRDEQLDRYASVDTRFEPVRLSEDRGFPLSSGELAFVRFAALASLFIENSSLLLFDEPETHLHPNFISQFAMLLDSLLAQTGSGAIISTHSAYFVRETFEDQVRILRSGPNREIEVVIPRLKTFGADVGTISYFVFGEDEPSRLAKQVEERLAGSDRPWESIFAQYKDELSLDLLSEIRAEVEG
jgi:ABC-type branched-subunit amino acid transport system ATPase component